MGKGHERGLLRSHEGKVTALRRTVDAAWIAVALLLANRLYPQGWDARDTIAASVAVALFVLGSEATGLYRSWRGSPLYREILQLLLTWVVVVPTLLLAAFVSKTSAEYSRQIVLTWFALAPALLAVWRTAVRFGLQELRGRGRNTRSVAIFGASESGYALARTILEQPWTGMRLAGIYDDRHTLRCADVPDDLPIDRIAGSCADLLGLARRGRIDLVYIALPLKAQERINSLLRQLADTTASVYLMADFFVFDLLRAQWGRVGDVPVVSMFESPFSGVDGWLKRVEDLVLGTAILLVLAVPMCVIAAGVKMSSPGPVLFRQRRYGLNGEEIRVLKFRTMTVCEDGSRPKQATRHDARVTRFGAFLRRTSLDELPQFLHVLSGKMSIVGPRPHAVAHNELYRTKIHGYMLRHKVKPGITGWAQVNGWRGETDTLEKMERRVEHDLEYIRRWRLGWDLKIVWMTLFGSDTHRNAY